MTSRRSGPDLLVGRGGLILLCLGLGLGFWELGQQLLGWEGQLASSSELAAKGVSPGTAGVAIEGSQLQLGLMTFLTVFVAEMGDKTQLATLLMSAQSQSPWAIFLGSAGALVTASLLSVLLGGGLGQVIPSNWLQWVAGMGFLGIGSYVLWREWQNTNLTES